jgi:hypothetical protein
MMVKIRQRGIINTPVPSPFSARLVITIITLRCLTLVYSIYDSTEEAIQKMIEASQGMLMVNGQGELGGINPVIKKHYELQIKTLQNAPRDSDKLEWLLKVKERQKDEAMYMEDTQMLVTEIEMLKVVLYLVNRNSANY